MIIWFVFMLFYCFGRREPTSEMGMVAVVFGGGAELIVDVSVVLSLIS